MLSRTSIWGLGPGNYIHHLIDKLECPAFHSIPHIHTLIVLIVSDTGSAVVGVERIAQCASGTIKKQKLDDDDAEYLLCVSVLQFCFCSLWFETI